MRIWMFVHVEMPRYEGLFTIIEQKIISQPLEGIVLKSNMRR